MVVVFVFVYFMLLGLFVSHLMQHLLWLLLKLEQCLFIGWLGYKQLRETFYFFYLMVFILFCFRFVYFFFRFLFPLWISLWLPLGKYFRNLCWFFCNKSYWLFSRFGCIVDEKVQKKRYLCLFYCYFFYSISINDCWNFIALISSQDLSSQPATIKHNQFYCMLLNGCWVLDAIEYTQDILQLLKRPNSSTWKLECNVQAFNYISIRTVRIWEVLLTKYIITNKIY